MDVKTLIEGAIEDLTGNASISSIMLKAQAISQLLDLQEFAEWVNLEQNGYPEGTAIPEYRRCRCAAKADLTQGFKRITNLDVPIDAIPDKTAQKVLSYLFLAEPISELEQMVAGASPEGVLSVVAPAYAYQKAKAIFPYADIDSLWKVAPVSIVRGVVTRVKSKLLAFFLELDKQSNIGIDFNHLEGKKEAKHIMNQTINAGIFHSGSGDITVSDSTVKNNVNTPLSETDISAIRSILSSIRENGELSNDQDAQEELSTVSDEIEKAQPNRKIIKKSLLFLKEVAVRTGAMLSSQAIIRLLGIV